MKKITPIFLVIICGLGIGWLLGLSVSPVLQIILTSLISLIVSIICILSGIQVKDDKPAVVLKRHFSSVSLLPICVLIIGICIGTPAGIYTRTNSLFGETPEHLKTMFERAGFTPDSANEYTKMYLLNQLFKNKENSSESVTNKTIAGLYSNENTTLCDLLRLQHGKNLLAILKAQNRPDINRFLEISNDSLSLEALKKLLCP